MERAKRGIAMQYLGHLKSNGSLAADFASSEVVHGSWAASFDWYEQMLKVTPEDVQRVAQKYLVPKNRTIGFLERGPNMAG
jgi:predicted Zn-dependent peptidase